MPEPVSVPPQRGPAEFTLDTEKAAEAVRALEAVRDDLALARVRAHQLSRQASTDRSARDLVSNEAFELLAQKADGVPGSLGFALDDGIVYVQRLIDQMNADIVEQRRVDDEA